MVAVAIVFLPLLGAIIAGLGGALISPRGAGLITCSSTQRLIRPCLLSARWAEIITCSATGASALGAVITLFSYLNGAPPVTIMLVEWIRVGQFIADWSLRIDLLTAIMMTVVSGISFLIHIYSIGYMHEDASRPRFFAYLSLFTFMMLMLVSADNFLQLFFGWEGVGLASYLLIGFWHHKDSANRAAIKAFIVNRVGDFGFVLGIFAIWTLFGSIEFDVVFAAAPAVAESGATVFGLPYGISIACILLFIGAMGKSAQFLLHTWLPDAMEGPTPVSALIHAATMVTAGVFLVARCSPLFAAAPGVLDGIVVIGAVTAFFAATIGLVQNDIKRVIAYSTCSQLGYMFVALGVGAYGVAIFHLVTHAFFKALLFLGSGSIIHALSGEQDMRRMGGLARYIPLSWAMMLIGTLSLTGFFFTAGYYSKDAIIESAFASGSSFGMFGFVMTAIAALLTAVYSWRLMLLTFHGAPRIDADRRAHIHESPAVMMIPLLVLAVGAIILGMIAAPLFLHVDADHNIWQGIFPETIIVALDEMHHVPSWVALVPSAMMVVGFLIAVKLYAGRPPRALPESHPLAPVRRFLAAKWYIDALYGVIFERMAWRVGDLLWRWGDIRLIDGYGPDGVAGRVLRLVQTVTAMQTGLLYHYALVMIGGLVVLLTFMLTAI